jgi:hypothetical protein
MRATSLRQVTWELQETSKKNLDLESQKKKCKGEEEASIARAHQPQAHTSTGLNHLCILSFSNNPSINSIVVLKLPHPLNLDCLILKS